MNKTRLPKEGWKNVKGTSNRKSVYGSFAEEWCCKTKQSWPDYCSVEGCRNRATVGAHLKNPSATGNKEYIAPLCDQCNNAANDDYFSLKGGISLAEVNEER